MESLKQLVRTRFPRLFGMARRLLDRFNIERRVLRQVGVRSLLASAVGRRVPWQGVLPRQRPQRFTIETTEPVQVDDIEDYFRGLELKLESGGHTIYLPPSMLSRPEFRELARSYPPGIGLKIMRNKGGIDSTHYLHGAHHSRLQVRITYGHRHLTLVANLLYAHGVGPRLYDLVELELGGVVWTAYVLEHIEGTEPSMTQCEEGISTLRAMEARRLFSVIAPLGFDHGDFQCPSCNGNALVDAQGRFKYIDFQNFVLEKYADYLRTLAKEAADASHFGDRSLLRGGTYLYQSIPGVGLPAKRDVARRNAVIGDLLCKAKVDLRGRVVLDVGCNVGMMMAEYLGMGAGWCHGWDRPDVVAHTDRLLLALGCTRFSTTGAELTAERRLLEDIPEFLRPRLDGCVISYLAVRGHLGWLEALRSLPWEVMIYEGHEGETQRELIEHVEQLRALLDIELLQVESYEDGDSEPRFVALLRNEAVARRVRLQPGAVSTADDAAVESGVAAVAKTGREESGDSGIYARTEPLDSPLVQKVRTTLRWLPTYAWQRARRRNTDLGGHILVALADHFEPSHVPYTGGVHAPREEQRRRLERWCTEYPRALKQWRDSDGRWFQRTYFYPAEQYEPDLVEQLAEHCRSGWGEIEVHLHHGKHRPDTAENLKRQLEEFRDVLAREHGCLSRWMGEGQPRYAFVHGNWALANSKGGRSCGVDNEIEVLQETGCYADMTLPSAPDLSQVRKINALYECSLPLSRRAPHRRGRDLRVGSPPQIFPLIMQGPLMLNFNDRRRTWRLARIENGALTANYPPSLSRLRLWHTARITVRGRPDWVFVKLHCHGMDPRDESAMYGAPMQEFLESITTAAQEQGFGLHFVTAREMANIALAACDGREGNPNEFRDYRLKLIHHA